MKRSQGFDTNKPLALLKWLLLAWLLSHATACGFQFRGAVTVPEQLKTISLKANPKKDFTKALIEHLNANGVRIATTAPVRLTITEDDHEKRTLSYNTRGKAAENEIIKRVAFKVTNIEDSSIMIESRLQARRTLLVDDTRVSSMGDQERLMREEMEFDLANQLVMQLLKQQ